MKQYDKDGKELEVDKKTEKERKTAFDAISKKAILVNLSRKQISNNPFDVKTTNKTAKWLNVAEPSMLQVRKFLFNPERLAKIRSLINDSLLMVWNHTRPWDNIGYRLLPMEYYDDFNETFGKIKDEFEEAVKEFIDNYDNHLVESKKLLGKAFDKNDYPDKSQLSTYFNLEIHTSKFPDIDDIRLNLSGPELMAMQSELVGQYDETIQSSINELAEMIESGVAKKHCGTLLRVIKKLNIDDNPEISMKIAELETSIGVEKEADKKEDTPESMMIMDDLEDMDDDLIDDYI